MFNILSHQGTVNQNDSEIPSYAFQNDLDRSKTQVRVHAGEDTDQGEHSSTAGGSANLYSCYGNKYGESSGNWKLICFKTSYTTPGHIPKGYPILPQRHLLNSVQSSFICNKYKLETT